MVLADYELALGIIKALGKVKTTLETSVIYTSFTLVSSVIYTSSPLVSSVIFQVGVSPQRLIISTIFSDSLIIKSLIKAAPGLQFVVCNFLENDVVKIRGLERDLPCKYLGMD